MQATLDTEYAKLFCLDVKREVPVAKIQVFFYCAVLDQSSS